MKNYTPQPNAIFDLDLLPESMLIILYLNSRGKNWDVYKDEVRKHLHLGHTRHNNAWKQLIRNKLLIKNKGFGKCDFVLNVDAVNALMSNDNVTHDNVTHDNVTYVSVRGTNTDVSTTTDDISNTNWTTNTDLVEIMETCSKHKFKTITKFYPDMDISTYYLNRMKFRQLNK